MTVSGSRTGSHFNATGDTSSACSLSARRQAPQQTLQICEAAGVAALLDVIKQVPAAAVANLPALGKEGFEIRW
jgi:hypothetical protein